jgi:hypothetical protein
MTLGVPGDVNNSVFQTNAYPLGRTYGMVPAAATDFNYRNNFAGELGGLNQDYRGQAMTAMRMNGTPVGMKANGMAKTNGKPSVSWLALAITFVAFVWIARRYAPDGETYANLKPNFINGVFLTFWIVLILTLLKVVAGAIKRAQIPLLQAPADLILSA